MKISGRILIALIALLLLCSPQPGSAYSVSFGDTHNYWPGWGTNASDNSQDSIGVPTFSGGSADINSAGRLTRITFNQTTASDSYWNILSAGDLFLDVNADQKWDYVVDLTNWTTAGKSNTDPGNGSYSIYARTIDLAGPGYILSGKDNTTDSSGDWSGYLIRDGHPVAASGIAYGEGNAFGQVGFSGWFGTPSTSYVFDFSSLNGGLVLGDALTIGWAPSCANDVIYETVRNPVPEPASMFLLGIGLFGLAGFGRWSVRTKRS